MTEFMVTHILEWLIPTVLAFLLGGVTAMLKRKDTRDKALEDGMTVQLMRGIKQDYETYVVKQHKMSMHDKEIHEKTFEAYQALGGNGVARGMHEEIMAKQPWIVTD